MFSSIYRQAVLETVCDAPDRHTAILIRTAITVQRRSTALIVNDSMLTLHGHSDSLTFVTTVLTSCEMNNRYKP
jgi:hypothetical protein